MYGHINAHAAAFRILGKSVLDSKSGKIKSIACLYILLTGVVTTVR